MISRLIGIENEIFIGDFADVIVLVMLVKRYFCGFPGLLWRSMISPTVNILEIKKPQTPFYR